MERYFKGYWVLMYRDIPMYVYEGLLFFLFLAIILILTFKGWSKGWRVICFVLLIEYVFLVYCITLLFRNVANEWVFNFKPFWSYIAYFRGEDPRLLPENIMNIVVFVPLGFLVGLSSRRTGWKYSLIIGVSLSIGIEFLQLLFKRGFCELDDVMHNTLGCLVGYGFYRLMKWSLLKLKNDVS